MTLDKKPLKSPNPVDQGIADPIVTPPPAPDAQKPSELEDVETSKRGPSQATRLVELAQEGGTDLFHTPAGDGYCSVAVNGHRETYSLRSRAAKE
jgi:hypothetical protein